MNWGNIYQVWLKRGQQINVQQYLISDGELSDLRYMEIIIIIVDEFFSDTLPKIILGYLEYTLAYIIFAL